MKRLIWMLPLLAIVIGALTSYFFYRSTTQLLTGLGSVDSPAVNQTQSLIFDLNSVADGFKSAVVAADKAALEPALQKADKFRQDVQVYAAVDGHAEFAAQIGSGFETYLKAAGRVTGILLDGQAGDVAEAAQAMQSALATLDTSLHQRKAAAQQALDGHIAQTQSLANRGFVFSVLASLLTLALSLCVSWWSVRHVMKQLGGQPEEATRIVQRLAGGDLSEPVQLKDLDGGSLLYAMRGMQAQLARVIGDVRSAVQQVHHAADDISHGNEALADRSSRQAASLQASATSIDQLTVSVRHNAESAEQARGVASRASQNADAGSRAVADAVSTMGEISERARKIVEITSLIDGIAFQTNILALNAAVEAARAGEQGRGFSVVASEVRILAQRAGAAAKDIKLLIDDSAQRIEVGARHVNAAGAAMDELVASVKQVGEHIDHIAAASTQQRAGIEQVNSAVAELDASTQQNQVLVEQAGTAAQALQDVARQLGDAVGQFRLNDRA
ncbi:MAG: methyl-accepting chemotaxis protein [Pseudomonadota bacterium]